MGSLQSIESGQLCTVCLLNRDTSFFIIRPRRKRGGWRVQHKRPSLLKLSIQSVVLDGGEVTPVNSNLRQQVQSIRRLIKIKMPVGHG